MINDVRNLPLGLAPGVGLSTYLTYGLVLGQGLSIKEAFTTVSHHNFFINSEHSSEITYLRWHYVVLCIRFAVALFLGHEHL